MIPQNLLSLRTSMAAYIGMIMRNDALDCYFATTHCVNDTSNSRHNPPIQNQKSIKPEQNDTFKQ